METAKQHFKQSQVLVPVFFLVSGALTLIAAGGAYTMNHLHHIAKPCFTVGAVLAALSIIYCIAMISILPRVKEFCKRRTDWNQQKASVATAAVAVEDGLSISSEDVQAADGDGIAFGPKRRRKKPTDILGELLTKEKRESDPQMGARGSIDSHSQQSRKDSSARRLSRTGKINFMGQPLEFGAHDESENLERVAEFQRGYENLGATEAPKDSARMSVSNKAGV